MFDRPGARDLSKSTAHSIANPGSRSGAYKDEEGQLKTCLVSEGVHKIQPPSPLCDLEKEQEDGGDRKGGERKMVDLASLAQHSTLIYFLFNLHPPLFQIKRVEEGRGAGGDGWEASSCYLRPSAPLASWLSQP